MIQLTHETPILLGVTPADFRCGIDGFAALCRLKLAQDPRDGTVFCFINRARTMIRALSYDGTGYWLTTKRLTKGKFSGWPDQPDALVSPVSARELRRVLQGSAWQQSSAPSTTPELASFRSSTTVNTTPAP